MARTLLLDVRDPEERRALLVEDGVPSLLWVEREDDRTLVGNVYLARVVRVEPSIDAAFLDLGLERPGFLPAEDAALPEAEEDANGNGHAADPAAAANGAGNGTANGTANGVHEAPRPRPIAETVKVGDEIVVQVARDAVGRKGPTITRHVSYPGRTLVLVPGQTRIAVSRKIAVPEERALVESRVRALTVPPGVGIVARTACAEATTEELAAEAERLASALRAAEETARTAQAPALLHAEDDFIVRAVRELAVRAPEGAAGPLRVIVDGPEDDLARVRRAVERMNPAPDVAAHDSAAPLFHAHGVERAVRALEEARVPLAGGASLVIHETEAMWTIDVNSGRLRTGEGIEETALATDLLAAKEAARQIRLRDLSGLVVIDLIDCREPANRAAVEECLRGELAKDPAKLRLAPLSEFMVSEITRRRLRSGRARSGSTTCPSCNGRGRLASAAAAGLAALRDARALLAERRSPLTFACSKAVAAELSRRGRQIAALGVQADVRADPSLEGVRFDVRRG